MVVQVVPDARGKVPFCGIRALPQHWGDKQCIPCGKMKFSHSSASGAPAQGKMASISLGNKQRCQGLAPCHLPAPPKISDAVAINNTLDGLIHFAQKSTYETQSQCNSPRRRLAGADSKGFVS